MNVIQDTCPLDFQCSGLNTHSFDQNIAHILFYYYEIS